jgi:hypothetical protein
MHPKLFPNLRREARLSFPGFNRAKFSAIFFHASLLIFGSNHPQLEQIISAASEATSRLTHQVSGNETMNVTPQPAFTTAQKPIFSLDILHLFLRRRAEKNLKLFPHEVSGS